MKKFFNRLLALGISMLMLLGCSVICFAAETNDVSMPDVQSSEDYVDVDFDICEEWISDNGIVELTIDKEGTVNLVESRETELLSASGSNESSSTVWSNDFYTDRSGTLHVWLSVTGSLHINVKVKLKGSVLTTNWVDETLSSGSGEFYSSDTIPGGSYVKVTLSSFKNGTNWSIRAWVD